MVPVRPRCSVTAASAASTVKVSGRPDHVQVVDLAALLAQSQALGQEQEVELGALGGLREVREGVELDVAARLRVAPHGGVVDAREVGGQVDLVGWLGHRGGRCVCFRSGRLRGVAVGGAGQAGAGRAGWRPRRRCGRHRGAGVLGPVAVGDRQQVVRDAGRPQPEAVCAGGLPVRQQIGELGRGADEDLGVADVLARPSSESSGRRARRRGAGRRRRGRRPGRPKIRTRGALGRAPPRGDGAAMIVRACRGRRAG